VGPFVGIFLFCYTVFPLSFAAGACLNYVLRIPRSPTCAALNVDAFGAVAADSISINSFSSHSRSQLVSGPHHVDPGCASDTIDMRFGFHMFACRAACHELLLHFVWGSMFGRLQRWATTSRKTRNKMFAINRTPVSSHRATCLIAPVAFMQCWCHGQLWCHVSPVCTK